MKTIAQIFAILLVCLLVVGATYGVSQTSWAARLAKVKLSGANEAALDQ